MEWRATELVPTFTDATSSLIIFLVANRLAIPAQRRQQLTVCGDHLVESTDVSMHISPALCEACDMFLHIAAQAFPLCAASTKRRQVMNVGVLRRETQEFVVAVNGFFG